jgi:hypothetical protein
MGARDRRDGFEFDKAGSGDCAISFSSLCDLDRLIRSTPSRHMR